MSTDSVLSKLQSLQCCSHRATAGRKRKNLSRLTKLLEEAKEKGIIPIGGTIDTRKLALAVKDEQPPWFEQAYDRGDENGPSRSFGDLLGGHGLQLRRLGPCRYEMPKKLPVVQLNRVIEEAEY